MSVLCRRIPIWAAVLTLMAACADSNGISLSTDDASSDGATTGRDGGKSEAGADGAAVGRDAAPGDTGAGQTGPVDAASGGSTMADATAGDGGAADAAVADATRLPDATAADATASDEAAVDAGGTAGESGLVDAVLGDVALEDGSAGDGHSGETGAAEAGGPSGDASGAGDASATGLLLYYPFDDGSGTVVTDLSGNFRSGNYENAVDAGSNDSGTARGWTLNGRKSGALAFAGAQDVAIPSGALAGVNDLTIGAWIRLDATSAWSRVFDFGHGPGGADDRWSFLTPNDGTGVSWHVFGGTFADGGLREAVVSSGKQLPTGVWKHVAVTSSGSNYQMFIDGFPAAWLANGPVISPSEMEPLAPQSWLGKSRFAPADPGLSGTLDELRVYGRVLTAPEVADLAWPKTDYSYWRFDEGSGTTVVDSSDNAIPTTLAGGATWTASGRLGAAVDLPGGPGGPAGPYVALADNPLKNCTSELTVASWLKVHALTSWSRLFDFGTVTTTFIYLAPTDGTGMHFAMVAPGGATHVFDLVAPAPFPGDDAWHHVAVTVAADGTVTLYVDGAPVKTGTSAVVKPSDFNAVNDLSFGRSRFPDPYLDGAIDDMRISCRAYTPAEIANLAYHP